MSFFCISQQNVHQLILLHESWSCFCFNRFRRGVLPVASLQRYVSGRPRDPSALGSLRAHAPWPMPDHRCLHRVFCGRTAPARLTLLGQAELRVPPARLLTAPTAAVPEGHDDLSGGWLHLRERYALPVLDPTHHCSQPPSQPMGKLPPR